MLQIVQAYDRSPIAEVATDGADTLEAKLDLAARTFRDRDCWLKPHERIEVLHRLASLMEGRRELFSRLIAQEGGKPLVDAIVETNRAIDSVRNALEELRHFAGREIPMGLTAASTGRWAFTTKEPIGVVVAISAFNHPLNLIVHQVAPAIAVGCPVIVKPAAATPLCCQEFVRLVHEAGLGEPWCQTFLTGDNVLAERLATDPRVGFVSFIGSARVGWHLHGKLAPGTRCALEHGGVAPAIVDRSADLDQVIEPPREVDRVASWIEEATAGGGRIVVGGERLSATTYRPTILLQPPASSKVSREEVFGPLTCIYGFTKLDEAIEVANSLPVAFQASIFTQAIGPALRAAERLDASAVMVNDHTAFRTDWMPFAGRRLSGYGIGGIPWSMREMTQEKMVVIRRTF